MVLFAFLVVLQVCGALLDAFDGSAVEQHALASASHNTWDATIGAWVDVFSY